MVEREGRNYREMQGQTVWYHVACFWHFRGGTMK